MAEAKSRMFEHLREPAKRARAARLLLLALLIVGAGRWTAYLAGEPAWAVRWQKPSWPAQFTFPISVAEHPLLAVASGLGLTVLLAAPLVASVRWRVQWGVALALLGMVSSLLPLVVNLAGMRSWPQMLANMVVLLLCMALTGLWAIGAVMVVRRRLVVVTPLVRSAIAHMGYVAYFVAVAVTSPGIQYHLPWMLAVCLSWLLVAAVLRTEDWGGRAYPWLAPAGATAALAGSMVLFFAGIGLDQREFPLLAGQVDPEALFPRGPLSRPDNRQVRDALGLGEPVTSRPSGTVWMEATLSARPTLQEAPRKWAISRLDDFIRSFPRSPHLPEALALRGRIDDTQLDLDLFKYWTLSFYENWPAEGSWPTWHRLRSEYPGTPWARLAAVRLAQLAARGGHWDDALRWLASEPREPDVTGLDEPTRRLLAEATMDGLLLRQRIEANRADPRYGDRPLAAYMKIDPRTWDAPSAMREAVGARDSLVADNIDLLDALREVEQTRQGQLGQTWIDEYDELQKADDVRRQTAGDGFLARRSRIRKASDARRRMALQEIATGTGDAACEALGLLAGELDTPGAAAPMLAEALGYYRQLAGRFPTLPLAGHARRRIERIAGTADGGSSRESGVGG
jgi:hypothetical protein